MTRFIGQELTVGGFVKKLERTKVGDFDLKKSIKLEKLDSENWKKYLIELDKKSIALIS